MHMHMHMHTYTCIEHSRKCYPLHNTSVLFRLWTRAWYAETTAELDSQHEDVYCSQKTCGRQRLSVSLADGERNTKGRTVRTSIHWDESTGEMRWNLLIQQPPKGAPPPTRGLGSIEPR